MAFYTKILSLFQASIVNPLHSSSIALTSSVLTTGQPQAIITGAQSPKSPSVHALPATTATQASVVSHANSTSNLMSTSLNSTQLQSHISTGGGLGGGTGTGPTSLSIHPSTVHVPSIMSTSLHSGSGSLAGANFDINGTAWNSTSSLSPTISSQHRKCEVKLNAMP